MQLVMSPPVENENEPHDGDRARSDEELPTTSRTPLLQSEDNKCPSVIQNILKPFQDQWLWELTAISTSIIFISIISVLLCLYDSSSLPGWSSVITVQHQSLHLSVFVSKFLFRSVQLCLYSGQLKNIVRVSCYSRPKWSHTKWSAQGASSQ